MSNQIPLRSGKGAARRTFLREFTAAGALASLNAAPAFSSVLPQATGGDDRHYWVEVLTRVAGPVLRALSQRKLKALMPVEAPHGDVADRRRFTYLEATGRLLCGISPWLESGPAEGPEGRLRHQYIDWARAAIQAATDPESPDYMNFNQGSQPVVDAAFLAQSVLRAPTQLWEKLDTKTRRNLVKALQSTRVIRPGFNNWLLFSAMIEAALCLMGEWWDRMRVDYALREHQSWYLGDGMYGDGPQFHWDYYNSYVIQPMLLDVLDTVSKHSNDWDAMRPAVLARAQRYAAIQERLISPEGTYPAIGRSLAYRFGAFHLLAGIALRRQLPEGLSPEQVRCALTAVMRRMIEAPGTFDEHGWLTVGFCGHQPAIGEGYISTGSCYLCSAAWLPLGLPPDDPFWKNPPQPWTQQKVWSGRNVPADHALGKAGGMPGCRA
ncbi:MAG TPA: DUF2264 domain-containing protein [Terriglobia bacterium]|nr:DUF2264 domain-containing protein [Terriglobia bacterium]